MPVPILKNRGKNNSTKILTFVSYIFFWSYIVRACSFQIQNSTTSEKWGPKSFLTQHSVWFQLILFGWKTTFFIAFAFLRLWFFCFFLIKSRNINVTCILDVTWHLGANLEQEVIKINRVWYFWKYFHRFVESLTQMFQINT